MPEDLLTRLPVAPEFLAGALALLVVLLLLRRIVARRRDAAERARQADLAASVADVPAEAPPSETDAELPGILYPMPVISMTEDRLLDALEDVVGDSVTGHRVLMQLSLNAFLYGCVAGRSRTQDPATIRQLATLQVDFLVVDAEWRPVLALDLERDAYSASPWEDRKLLALDRAGIAHLTICADGVCEALREEIHAHLGHAQDVAAE